LWAGHPGKRGSIPLGTTFRESKGARKSEEDSPGTTFVQKYDNKLMKICGSY